MTVDYLVSSLPALSFDAPAPIDEAAFNAACGGYRQALPARWHDLETQLRNAMAEARGRSDCRRAAFGCDLYWQNRIRACFQEKSVIQREDALDRVWWDAAGELTDPAAPLGRGALATYAVRLGIVLRRTRRNQQAGEEAFERTTSETKG